MTVDELAETAVSDGHAAAAHEHARGDRAAGRPTLRRPGLARGEK